MPKLKCSARRHAFVFESSPPITTRPSKSSFCTVSSACLNCTCKINYSPYLKKMCNSTRVHMINLYSKSAEKQANLLWSFNLVPSTANHVKTTLPTEITPIRCCNLMIIISRKKSKQQQDTSTENIYMHEPPIEGKSYASTLQHQIEKSRNTNSMTVKGKERVET